MLVLLIIVAWLFLLLPFLFGFRGTSGILLFLGVFVALNGILTQKVLPFLLSPGISPVTVGIIQLITFILLSIVSVYLAIFSNRFVQINFDPFDWVLGTVLGLAAGVVGVYFLLSFSLLASTGSALHDSLSNTFMVHQFVEFKGWHAFLQNLHDLVSSEPKPLPDIK